MSQMCECDKISASLRHALHVLHVLFRVGLLSTTGLSRLLAFCTARTPLTH